MRFRLKILLCMVLLLTAAYSAGGALLISRSFAESLERETDSAVRAFRGALSALSLVNAAESDQRFSDISATLDRIYDYSGWALAELYEGDRTVYSRGSAGLSQPRTESGDSLVTVFSEGEEHWLQVSGDLNVNRATLRLNAVRNISAVYDARARQQSLYRRVFCALFFAAGTLSWAAAWLLTRPLGEVSAAARRMAGGDLDVRLAIRSRDEVGQLAESFNYMAGRLDGSIRAMQDEVDRQERFMGSFAHELKTPMTSIIGYADLIRTQALDEGETMEAAHYIFSEGRRLESLSLKLLELLVAKNQEIAPAPTAVDQLVSSVVRTLRPVCAQSGVTLRSRCEPGACLLDADLIRSLLVNLVDNARKAIEGSGNVYIVADWPEDRCRIRVLDNGRGMPPEAVAHVTEAFYRVDKSRSRAQGGAGLGLTLCRQIVELHGGELAFDSRVGNGTCVTVTLGQRLDPAETGAGESEEEEP